MLISYICFVIPKVKMTAKGVFLFLLLLLSCGTSFAFPKDNLHFDEQAISVTGFEFEEEIADLYQGTVSFSKTNVFQVYSFTDNKNFLLPRSFEAQSQKDYLRRSKEIDPSLDIPAIIFPFHVFL